MRDGDVADMLATLHAIATKLDAIAEVLGGVRDAVTDDEDGGGSGDGDGSGDELSPTVTVAGRERW
jgi:hypothetical protein